MHYAVTGMHYAVTGMHYAVTGMHCVSINYWYAITNKVFEVVYWNLLSTTTPIPTLPSLNIQLDLDTWWINLRANDGRIQNAISFIMKRCCVDNSISDPVHCHSIMCSDQRNSKVWNINKIEPTYIQDPIEAFQHFGNAPKPDKKVTILYSNDTCYWKPRRIFNLMPIKGSTSLASTVFLIFLL